MFYSYSQFYTSTTYTSTHLHFYASHHSTQCTYLHLAPATILFLWLILTLYASCRTIERVRLRARRAACPPSPVGHRASCTCHYPGTASPRPAQNTEQNIPEQAPCQPNINVACYTECNCKIKNTPRRHLLANCNVASRQIRLYQQQCHTLHCSANPYEFVHIHVHLNRPP